MTPQPRLIAPRSEIETEKDQLIELLRHSDTCTIIGCCECQRLAAVLELAKEPLLMPFR